MKITTPEIFKSKINSQIDFETNQIIYQYVGKNYIIEATANKDDNIITFISFECFKNCFYLIKSECESEAAFYSKFLDNIRKFRDELTMAKDDLNKSFCD